MDSKLYVKVDFDPGLGEPVFARWWPGLPKRTDSHWTKDVNEAYLFDASEIKNDFASWDRYSRQRCAFVPVEHLKAFAGYKGPTKLYVIKTDDGRFWCGVNTGFKPVPMTRYVTENHGTFYEDVRIAERDVEMLVTLHDMEDVRVCICSVERTQPDGIDLTTLAPV